MGAGRKERLVAVIALLRGRAPEMPSQRLYLGMLRSRAQRSTLLRAIYSPLSKAAWRPQQGRAPTASPPAFTWVQTWLPPLSAQQEQGPGCLEL